MSIRALLESVQLADLADAFEAEGIEAGDIVGLEDRYLLDLGVRRLGDRVRLRAAAKAVGEAGPGATVAAPRIVPTRRAAPAPAGPRGITVLFGGSEFVVWFRDTMSLGRSPAEGADVRLAVEPYLPAELYPDNHARSFQISRVHLRLERRPEGIYATCVGAAGASLEGVMVTQNVPFPVVGDQEIGVAQVLTLKTRLHGLEGEQAVEIRRKDNRPELSYVLGTKKIGLMLYDGVELLVGEEAMGGLVRIGLEEGVLVYSCMLDSTFGGAPVPAETPLRAGEGFQAEGVAEDGTPWNLSVTPIV